MVLVTQVVGYAKGLPRKFLRRGLIDTLRIHVKGGSGGSGLPRYGGVGGSGGNVCITSRSGLSLEKVKAKLKSKRLSAEPGGSSSSKGIIGVPGADLNIDVPLGITVYDENGLNLGEVNADGDTLVVAKGGIGGCPETGFCGLRGQAHSIVLDFKLVADVGLVGFPNAGKSTLLSVVSRSKPKIANYPFTTIRPFIGTIDYRDERQITVADLPGLIEGAHINAGMGHKFLKHLHRTKLLLFVVDINGFQISVKHNHRTCLETVLLLNKEIELYKPDLLNKPAMIIVNKMDTKDADKIYEDICPKLKNLSEFASECDESMRPEKVLQFSNIITASLILRKRDEIQHIRRQIRNMLDKYEKEQHSSQDSETTEDQLREKLKRLSQRYAPTLV